MQHSRTKLGRRLFLGALGLGVSAPLALRMSRRAVALPAARPCRLFVMYIPHGMPIEHFAPTGSDGNLTLNPSPNGILAPLEPYKKYLTFLSGIGMSGGASNHAAIRAVLTGSPDGSGGDSIDALIARKLGVGSHAMGTIPYSQGGGFFSDSFLLRQGTWVRPEVDPGKSAEALLGGAVAMPGAMPAMPGAMPAMPANDEAQFRKEVLALTEKELEGVQKVLSGLTTEPNKLQIHLDAVRAMKDKAGALLVSPNEFCTSGRVLPAVAAVRGKNPLDPANFGLLLDANLEIAASALGCGASRIITLQNMYANAGINMGFAGGPGVAKAHHDPVSHSWDADGRAEFAACQRWFYQRLTTKLIKVLAETADPADTSAPDRNLLDNTVILVCSEVSDGANHNSDASEIYVGGKPLNTSLPMVLIGGGGGYLKTGGRIVNVKRQHADVLATVADAMGAPLSNIGGQAVTPIAEVKA